MIQYFFFLNFSKGIDRAYKRDLFCSKLCELQRSEQLNMLRGIKRGLLTVAFGKYETDLESGEILVELLEGLAAVVVDEGAALHVEDDGGERRLTTDGADRFGVQIDLHFTARRWRWFVLRVTFRLNNFVHVCKLLLRHIRFAFILLFLLQLLLVLLRQLRLLLSGIVAERSEKLLLKADRHNNT